MAMDRGRDCFVEEGRRVAIGIRIAILVVALLATLVVLFFGFEHHRRASFRAACKSVRRGEAPDEVARSLEAAGGVYQGISEDARVWYLERVISPRRGICKVFFDLRGAVGAVHRGTIGHDDPGRRRAR
jgi:hypothetical protein